MVFPAALPSCFAPRSFTDILGFVGEVVDDDAVDDAVAVGLGVALAGPLAAAAASEDARLS